MLKHIQKSDINLRPFKVYKSFGANETDYPVAIAEESSDLGYTDDTILERKTLYHRIKTMYYNGDNALNPFLSYGTFKPTYSNLESAKQRSLKDRALVLKIPQIKFGEEIKPGSINLLNNDLNEIIYDDSYGNLSSNYNSYELLKFDIENADFWFYDADSQIVKTKIIYCDVEVGELLIATLNSIQETVFILLRVDVELAKISFLGTFKHTDLNLSIIGNVIYSHGVIILTRDTGINEARENSLQQYTLEYKSTNTIYENEILLVVGEDEFNVSTNKSSQIEIDGSMFQSPLFAEYEYSSSVDPIGSYLAPYITTIGLYDENMDMVAIAKLATPVKSTPDLPVNFLVRFDT
jgi:hypothetical protein